MRLYNQCNLAIGKYKTKRAQLLILELLSAVSSCLFGERRGNLPISVLSNPELFCWAKQLVLTNRWLEKRITYQIPKTATKALLLIHDSIEKVLKAITQD